MIRTGFYGGLFLAVFGCSLPCPAAAETLAYDIVTNGVVNGEMTVDIQPGGRVSIANRYQQQDKIRAFTAEVTVDGAGLPIAMRRVGEAFAFQPIDELFKVVGPRATWRNRVESGSANAAGRYYVPFGLTYGSSLARDGAAYELGLLAAALVEAGEAGLPLLPVGQANAHVVTEANFADHGDSVRLRLVAITGTSLDPIYLWLDEQNRFFAGDGVIRRGWRGLEATLSQAVAETDEQQVERAVASLDLGQSASSTLIRDVSLFDSRRGKILPHRSVLMREGKIVRIAPASRLKPAPKDTVIDGRGATLLPGLWDMHVHLRPRDPLRFLATGVTSVRDMGNNNAALARLEQRLAQRRIPGPTIIKAGFIDAAGPAATYNGSLVASEAEAIAAVDAYADSGFTQIKLYNQVKPEWVPAIARRAHARGLRLSGHIPFGATVKEMVDAGYDEVQHLVYPLLGIEEQPAHTPLTFNAARVAQSIDETSAQVAGFADLLRRNNIALDMTLSVYEPLFLAKSGEPSPAVIPLTAELPAAAARQTMGGALPTPAGMTDAQFRQAFRKSQALMAVFDRRKVALVAGTDTPSLGGLTMPRELELMVTAGLQPARALQIATYDAAKTMAREFTSGSVEVGKVADAILVEGDPTQDITRIRHLRKIIKAGVAFDPRLLMQAAHSGRSQEQ